MDFWIDYRYEWVKQNVYWWCTLYTSWGGYQKLGARVPAQNEDYENFKGAIYICKDKQLPDSWEVPNSWYEEETGELGT